LTPQEKALLGQGFTITAEPGNTSLGTIDWSYDPRFASFLAPGERATIQETVLVEDQTGLNKTATVSITLAGARPTPQESRALKLGENVLEGVSSFVEAAAKFANGLGVAEDPAW
jgi:hypothetical protein